MNSSDIYEYTFITCSALVYHDSIHQLHGLDQGISLLSSLENEQQIYLRLIEIFPSHDIAVKFRHPVTTVE